MRAVGVSLPLAQPVRLAVAPLLHAVGEEIRELPGTVGGCPALIQCASYRSSRRWWWRSRLISRGWSSAATGTAHVFDGWRGDLSPELADYEQ
jgi:bifunctional non-homologous end joining protein LigD